MNWPCATINHRFDSDRAWVDTLPDWGYSEIELCPRYTLEATEELIGYALEKGVGISLHVHHGPNNITDTDQENQKLSTYLTELKREKICSLCSFLLSQ